jgi:hypothetical protein
MPLVHPQINAVALTLVDDLHADDRRRIILPRLNVDMDRPI